MYYRLYDIAPALKPFVKTICSVESNGSGDVLMPMRVLPDTCVELFVNFGEPQNVASTTGTVIHPGRSFITSRMNSFMDIRTPGRVGFVSVCFAGGSAYPFFPVPMHNVANQIIDLRDLWGQLADEMQDRVDSAQTIEQRVGLIQHYLLARLRQSARPDRAIDFCIGQIKQANGQLSVEELASRTGMSNRHLVRRFNQCIGLSPKEFARMTTFLQALKLLKNYPAWSLTEIAYESGYYDQAHFIHACRDYSGLTPSQLVATNRVLY